MPRYRLKKEHYLQSNKDRVEPQLHAKGEEISCGGTPSLHMEPLDKEARDRVDARLADFGEKKQEAAKRRAAGRVGWTPAFEANYERIITRPEPGENAPAQAAAGSAARTARRKAA